MEAFHSEPLKYITDSVIEVFRGLYDPRNTAWFDRQMEALFRVEQSTIESDNNVWVVPSEKIVSSYIPKAETTVPMLVDFLSDALSRAKESDHRNYTYDDYNRIDTYELALKKWETAYWYYKDMVGSVEPQPTKSAANFKNAAGSPQAATGEPQRPTIPMEGEMPTESKKEWNNTASYEPFTDLINDTFDKDKVLAWLHKKTDNKKGKLVAYYFTALYDGGILHDYPKEATFEAEFPLVKGTFEGILCHWRLCRKKEEKLTETEKRKVHAYKEVVSKIDVPEFA